MIDALLELLDSQVCFSRHGLLFFFWEDESLFHCSVSRLIFFRFLEVTWAITVPAIMEKAELHQNQTFLRLHQNQTLFNCFGEHLVQDQGHLIRTMDILLHEKNLTENHLLQEPLREFRPGTFGLTAPIQQSTMAIESAIIAALDVAPRHLIRAHVNLMLSHHCPLPTPSVIDDPIEEDV